MIELRDGILRLPLGGGRISFIDSRDVAAAVTEVLYSSSFDNATLVLTGPEPLQGAQIVSRISEVLGIRMEYGDMSESEAQAYLERKGVSSVKIANLLEIMRAGREDRLSLVTTHYSDITDTPSTSVVDFIRDSADLFSEPARMPT